jgi:hypothetical protein
MRIVVSLTLVALALAGCGRDEIKTYRVVKEDSTAPPPDQVVAPDQNSTTQPQLQWMLPDGWQEKTPGQMRVASFTVTNTDGQTADVGVIPLPAGENELDLVNMWRDQMQLPAITNETATESVSVGNDSAKLFEIASEQPLIDGKFRARILVAMFTRGETSWFFKMTGEDSFIASQKQNFLQFLKSVSFAGNAPMQIAPAPTAPNEGGKSIWTIPPDWKQINPGVMLLAKFSITSGDGKAEVNVSSLAGEGGGLAANVNRWRGQLGLPPISEILTSSIDVAGSKAEVVDMSGIDAKTGKSARLIGAIVPQNGQTWFYKLMGDETVVARQKDAFITFIQSADYSNAP